MSPKHKRKKGDFPPECLQNRVQTQLRRLGTAELAEALGLSRNAVLGVAAGARCLPGSLALIRERLPALEVECHPPGWQA